MEIGDTVEYVEDNFFLTGKTGVIREIVPAGEFGLQYGVQFEAPYHEALFYVLGDKIKVIK
jgi:hypothetical protein